VTHQHQTEGIGGGNEIDGFFVIHSGGNLIAGMLQNESSDVLQRNITADGKN
jgi:hypothetical protein